MSEKEKPDSKPTPAEKGAADAKALVGAAADGAKGAVDAAKDAGKAVKDAASSDATDKGDKDASKEDEKSGTGIGGFFEDAWKKIKKFFSSFKEDGAIGSIIGGLLGLGGAWFAGNFFGGGILSTILMIALAVPLMLAGSDTIGGWINGKLGTSKAPVAGADVAKSPAVSPTVQQPAAQQSSSTPTPQPVGVAKALNNEELQALLDKPDNLKDRICADVDNNNVMQVRAVADSEPDQKCNLSYETLRDSVLAKVAAPTGIVFTPLSDGNIRVVATTIGSLPNSSTGPARQ